MLPEQDCCTLYALRWHRQSCVDASTSCINWCSPSSSSVAQVINLVINVTGAVRWGWCFSLGFAFVPSFVLFMGGVFLPDSPNSLLERGKPEQVNATQSCPMQAATHCPLNDSIMQATNACCKCLELLAEAVWLSAARPDIIALQQHGFTVPFPPLPRPWGSLCSIVSSRLHDSSLCRTTVYQS